MNVGRLIGTAVLGFFFLLFVALDLKWLDQLAKQAGLPDDSDLLIVDQGGTILASSLDISTRAAGRQVLQGMTDIL